jgi:ABC-type uncharacterized transport system permease subunit
MSSSDFGALVRFFIVYGVSFILGAFGGMYSECSGIINIALEGSMVVGAFSGLTFLWTITSNFKDSWMVTTYGGLFLTFFIGCVIAIIVGCLFSFLLSFVSIKLKADQTIVGTALNTVALALCAIVNTFIWKIDSTEVYKSVYTDYLSLKTGNDFVDSAFSGINSGVFLGLILIVILWLAMDKTRFGLRLRACGENPGAADAVGINVNKMRYLGTMIGSASAALGGFIVFSSSQMTIWNIDALGYGFLVLAVEIFGNWKCWSIVLASLFFAFFFGFAPSFTAALSNNPSLATNFFTVRPFYYMLPYLLAFLSLIFFSKHSHAPKSEGIPYDKSSR